MRTDLHPRVIIRRMPDAGTQQVWAVWLLDTDSLCIAYALTDTWDNAMEAARSLYPNAKAYRTLLFGVYGPADPFGVDGITALDIYLTAQAEYWENPHAQHSTQEQLDRAAMLATTFRAQVIATGAMDIENAAQIGHMIHLILEGEA